MLHRYVIALLLCSLHDSEGFATCCGKDFTGTRIVSVGDLHGDYEHAVMLLQGLGLVKEYGGHVRWNAVNTKLVQTGDLMDRGLDDEKLIDMFASMKVEAKESGSEVVVVMGNHEVMHMGGDYRYFHPQNQQRFNCPPADADTIEELNCPDLQKAWGPYAPIDSLGSKVRQLVHRSEVLTIVGDVAFVHGGLSMATLRRYSEEGVGQIVVDAVNDAARQLTLQTHDVVDNAVWNTSGVFGSEGPLWDRDLASDPGSLSSTCQNLISVLKKLQVERLVVGHTPTFDSILPVCKGRAILADTGMSLFYSESEEESQQRLAAVETCGESQRSFAVYPRRKTICEPLLLSDVPRRPSDNWIILIGCAILLAIVFTTYQCVKSKSRRAADRRQKAAESAGQELLRNTWKSRSPNRIGTNGSPR